MAFFDQQKQRGAEIAATSASRRGPAGITMVAPLNAVRRFCMASIQFCQRWAMRSACVSSGSPYRCMRAAVRITAAVLMFACPVAGHFARGHQGPARFAARLAQFVDRDLRVRGRHERVEGKRRLRADPARSVRIALRPVRRPRSRGRRRTRSNSRNSGRNRIASSAVMVTTPVRRYRSSCASNKWPDQRAPSAHPIPAPIPEAGMLAGQTVPSADVGDERLFHDRDRQRVSVRLSACRRAGPKARSRGRHTARSDVAFLIGLRPAGRVAIFAPEIAAADQRGEVDSTNDTVDTVLESRMFESTFNTILRTLARWRMYSNRESTRPTRIRCDRLDPAMSGFRPPTSAPADLLKVLSNDARFKDGVDRVVRRIDFAPLVRGGYLGAKIATRPAVAVLSGRQHRLRAVCRPAASRFGTSAPNRALSLTENALPISS